MNATPIDINALAALHDDAIKVRHRACEERIRRFKTYTTEYTTKEWLESIQEFLPEDQWLGFVALWKNATPQERKDWFRASTDEAPTEWDDDEDDMVCYVDETDEDDGSTECDYEDLGDSIKQRIHESTCDWVENHIKEVAPHLKAQEELEELTEELEDLKNAALRAVDAAWKTYNEKSEAIAKKMFHLKMAEEAKNKVLMDKIMATPVRTRPE